MALHSGKHFSSSANDVADELSEPLGGTQSQTRLLWVHFISATTQLYRANIGVCFADNREYGFLAHRPTDALVHRRRAAGAHLHRVAAAPSSEQNQAAGEWPLVGRGASLVSGGSE